MKKVFIICSGEMKNYDYFKNLFMDSYLISVDGGSRHLRKLGLLPDILIGDFDSTFEDDFKYFKNKGCKIKKYNTKKDETDTHIALDYAIENGFTDITILGALGNRMDHSLANIYLLEHALEKKIECKIIDEDNEIFLTDKKIFLEGDNNWNLSLIPLTKYVKGVTTDGLYYPLYSSTLKRSDSLGISNLFLKNTVSISIEEGLLLIIKSRD